MSPNQGQREDGDEEGAAQSVHLLHDLSDNESINIAPTTKSSVYLLPRIYLIVFLINLAFQVLAPAQTQIFESIYCSQHYKQHPTPGLPDNGGNIPESFCKLPPIQTQISTLRGYLEFFYAAPGLLLSIPMGLLADKIGRRRLVIPNVGMLFLSQVWTTFVTWLNGGISLRFAWLGAGFNLLAGGPIVTELLYICILVDISPTDQVAEAFFRAQAFNQFAKVVGPFIAGMLMRHDAWLAVYFGMTALAICVVMVTTVPETLHWQKPDKDASNEGLDQDEQPRGSEDQRPQLPGMRRFLNIWSDWRLLFVALTYPFRLICTALSDLLQRYVSDRYGWTLANATLIYSLQAIFAALILFTLLPSISGYIDRKYSFSIIRKNASLARVSLFAMFLAYTVIGLAPNAYVMMLGLLLETLSNGFPGTLRAIATAIIDEGDRGTVFSVFAIAEALSTMIAYPTTAALFNVGIEKGGAWLGLPYDIVSLIALLGFVFMCLVKFEKPVKL